MRRLLQVIVPVGIVSAGLLLTTTQGWARPEYSRKTKKDCAFCHPHDSWNLTDAGKYYRDHKYSLEGYKPK